MNEETNPLTGLEIAVIGMSGRFPGADNINEFWENLKNGVESISFFSDEELEAEGIDPQLIKNPNYVKARGALADIEHFDASFFGFTPSDAKVLDPQTRLFLECSWEALEDAGYDPGSYNGYIGLYAGASDNFPWQAETRLTLAQHPDQFLALILNNKDSMSLLVSYKLDLKGPSFTMFTACSSSLVSVHLACQAILNGECDMALAGGVTVTIPNKTGYLYQPGLIFSLDGRCRAFDAAAKGTVFGSGVGIVALKRLEEAVEDRDNIYAVIKGSAINNDGLRKVGFTAPSIEGQGEVIRTAQQMAQVEAESITYVETHGTGTELGDPVEIEGLKSAFDTKKKNFCAIGSVKTNVGHLDSAAGVTGFIKAALALKHRLIPPSLHFETPNPRIDFENSPFYVVTEATEWENDSSPGGPLRAGVSSFGIGGTNAHVVLEEWAAARIPPGSPGDSPRLLLLSAKTPAALDRMTENFITYLQEKPAANLTHVSYTLAVGRKHFRYRRMAVCSSMKEAIDGFSSQVAAGMHTLAQKDDLEISETGSGADAKALEKIGRSWLTGERFDWKALYTGEEGRRISLPTYPFEKEHYWVEGRLWKMMSQTGEQLAFPGVAPEGQQVVENKGEAPARDMKPRPHLMNPYTAPGNQVEENICEAWKQLFGFAKIGIDDDFYELGGDSTKAITLTSMLGKIGIAVTITDILSNATIKQLAALINEKMKTDDLAEEIFERRQLEKLDCLEKLNKGRNKRNIFIVHNNTGLVSQYKELAVLLEGTFNVYGIQARGCTPAGQMPQTPAQMVADYIEQILFFQEQGPYIIAGCGGGCAPAFEMGARLEKSNRKVEKIVLLDSPMFISDSFFKVQKRLKSWPGFAVRWYVSRQEKKFRKEIRKRNLFIEEQDEKTGRREKVQGYMEALNKRLFSFGPVKTSLLVLQAGESPHPAATQERFDRLSESSAAIIEVPGASGGMLEKPAVEKLAQVILNNL
ncbi:MAG: hypothetical protein KAW12_14325 [Candidatus Aminicenantes bacterium]|nr:hypothetical protein [Candidatus Aminicenantes bacterium]